MKTPYAGAEGIKGWKDDATDEREVDNSEWKVIKFVVKFDQ